MIPIPSHMTFAAPLELQHRQVALSCLSQKPSKIQAPPPDYCNQSPSSLLASYKLTIIIRQNTNRFETLVQQKTTQLLVKLASQLILERLGYHAKYALEEGNSIIMPNLVAVSVEVPIY
jgi:hypothetical protein